MATRRHLVGGASAQGLNVLKETTNRAPGLLDMAGFVLGVRPYKQLRLRVVILRDEAGEPLATEAEVMPSLDAAQAVFTEQCRVRVQAAGPFVVTVPHPSPTAALDVHCDDGAWQEDFAEAGNYFRRHEAATGPGRFLGYGAPITVFIVRDISNKGGCSLGPLANYVTLEAKMLPRARHRLLAHEVAHACGLWHSKNPENLMYPKVRGGALNFLQTVVLRNSRHVTLL